ncbi:peregrin [Caerostris extrusa]|nr:peregrin [Caerostris extrusa]
MPNSGYFHNGVPIPVPPEDVLALKANYEEDVYLVLFFDTKRTWQWLPRNKLEPLGVDSKLDKARLVESKKAAERKAVKKAFENAILHRCRVTGESTIISNESGNES